MMQLFQNMLGVLKCCFFESTESQISNALSIMQIGQTLMILEHFKVSKLKLIFVVFFVAFWTKTTKRNKKWTILSRYCRHFKITYRTLKISYRDLLELI